MIVLFGTSYELRLCASPDVSDNCQIQWAGFIVEALTNQTLEVYMQENIWKPCGMSSTTFFVAKRPDLAKHRAAMGMRATPRGPLVSGKEDVPEEPEKCSGGSGLYGCASDYAKFLSALVKGELLNESSIKQLFEPQLPDNAHLQAVCDSPWHDALCPEFPVGLKVNYALGGAVNMEDVPEKRRKGSLMWSGMPNLHWVRPRTSTTK